MPFWSALVNISWAVLPRAFRGSHGCFDRTASFGSTVQVPFNDRRGNGKRSPRRGKCTWWRSVSPLPAVVPLLSVWLQMELCVLVQGWWVWTETTKKLHRLLSSLSSFAGFIHPSKGRLKGPVSSFPCSTPFLVSLPLSFLALRGDAHHAHPTGKQIGHWTAPPWGPCWCSPGLCSCLGVGRVFGSRRCPALEITKHGPSSGGLQKQRNLGCSFTLQRGYVGHWLDQMILKFFHNHEFFQNSFKIIQSLMLVWFCLYQPEVQRLKHRWLRGYRFIWC